MIRFIFRLLSALFFGALISVWIIQNNIDVQRTITSKLIAALEKEWNIKITTEGSTVNFFTSSLYLKKLVIKPKTQKQFAWGCDECKIHISLFQLLRHRIELYLTFVNTSGHTGYNNGEFDITGHLIDIFTTHPTDLFKIVLKTITMYNINVDASMHGKTVSLDVPGILKIARHEEPQHHHQKFWDGLYNVHNASISIDKLPVITHIASSSQFFNTHKDTSWQFATDTQCKVAQNKYLVKGLWNTDIKQAKISDTDKTVQIVAQQSPGGLHVTGSLPLDKITNFANIMKPSGQKPEQTHANISGTCTADIIVALENLAGPCHGTGHASITDIRYNNNKIPDISLDNMILSPEKISAIISAHIKQDVKLSGRVTWKFSEEIGDLVITNTEQLALGKIISNSFDAWVIRPRGLSVSANINKNLSCSGDYKIKLSHQTSAKKDSYLGSYFIDSNGLSLSGKNNLGHYVVASSFKPHVHLTTWSYTKRDKKIVDLATRTKEDTKLTGIVHYTMLKSFLDHSVKRLVWGNNCSFALELDQSSFDVIQGSIKLNDGRFYIPENRNLVERFKTNFLVNITNKKITLKDCLVGFSKGTISSPQATVYLNDDYSLGMIHVPIQIENLFVNWKRDFYGFIYGNLLLNKLANCPPKISGNIVLKKSLLRENIFSEDATTNFYGPSTSMGPNSQALGYDIRITTEKPIKARTSALEAYASLNLRVQYMHNQDLVQVPRITGTINLENGYLKFLRSKLMIEYGRIHFITNQMNDPIIDLVAKNRINKYQVTLQATGSLQKPNIILESTPELTEEQILGLILAGSENATLQADLPAMLMQNLNNIILGSKQHLPKATTFFEKITKPFKYVQITPNFSDQAGRGGIKGIVSIDLNEQMHAQIQKNFNLQEDFSAQFEYLLSDDINIKVVKDYRGELGSEVEVRLKL